MLGQQKFLQDWERMPGTPLARMCYFSLTTKAQVDPQLTLSLTHH